jgi:hypothetical protein
MPNFGHYPEICLEGPRKNTKTLSEDRLSPGQDLNLEPSEYETGALTTWPQSSNCYITFKSKFFEFIENRRSGGRNDCRRESQENEKESHPIKWDTFE